jgi:hypothetical protein
VSAVKVQYQAQTGRSSFLYFLWGLISAEYWIHQSMKAHHVLIRCLDCGKMHRERKVVRELEEAVREVNEILTSIFGL